ncbi:MAG: BlaI/MecI/CopY family transcriptional regulator, partial [Sutterellaceae bacterium]|nr:BlaI/MecI/CopY family transcriptional regulator [Sutterellaceae bacterium]
ADELERSIVSAFRFSMKPPCGELCRTERIHVGKMLVIAARVLEGPETPYYVTLRQNGREQSLCFLRHGSENREATDQEVRGLYQKSRPVPLEEQPSPVQELTFSTLKKYFDAAGVEFTEGRYPILGLVDRTGFFTNLGLWVSDQSNVETRLGFFSGTDKASGVEGISTLTGSIVSQCDAILGKLSGRSGYSFRMDAHVIGEDFAQDEPREYPAVAVREALASMFAHRDYGFSASSAQAFVGSFSDHLEFLCFGEFSGGAEEDQIREGVSIPRNRKLAGLLARLCCPDRHGLGIPLMYASYRPSGLEPSIEVTPHLFRIQLPRITGDYSALSERERAVLGFLRTHGPALRREIQESLGKSLATTLTVLELLTKKQFVVKAGTGRNVRYRIK